VQQQQLGENADLEGESEEVLPPAEQQRPSRQRLPSPPQQLREANRHVEQPLTQPVAVSTTDFNTVASLVLAETVALGGGHQAESGIVDAYTGCDRYMAVGFGRHEG
jgi:hypothetical protein